MTHYAWFPVDLGVVPYAWNDVADWSNAGFWANVDTPTFPPVTGTLPGAADTAYVFATNPPSGPADFSPPPYTTTLLLTSGSQTIGTLGLGFYAPFGPQLLPTISVQGAALRVVDNVIDHFVIDVPRLGLTSFAFGGNVQLSGGASVEVGTSSDPAITYQFTDGFANRLVFDGVSSADPTAVRSTIRGFLGGDAIDLTGVPFAGATATYLGGTLFVRTGAVVDAALVIPGASLATDSFLLRDDGTGHVLVVLCMAEGTRIATPTGEIAVEDLREGDLVLAGQGRAMAARPVRWIGRRRIDLRSHARPEQARPVRIRRDAFADAVPRRDVLLSPDHAVLVDGLLVPARLLVNGATIAREVDLAAVVYYHVELDRHDVLLAEGLPVESYLDTGNRAIFENAGTALILHPEFAVNTALRHWATDACAPLVTDPARMEPIWQALATRAAARGYAVPPPAGVAEPGSRLPDALVSVDDRDIRPVPTRPGWCAFPLPPGTRSLRLRSAAVRPSDARPWLDDGRRLGLAVSAIRLSEAGRARAIALDDPALATGWWGVERDGAALWRWTDGDALLHLSGDASLLEVCCGPARPLVGARRIA